jgi:hypothetical protein
MLTDIDPTDLTEAEAQDILRNFQESKANLHTFLTNVIKAHDTTKTGNLTEEELGMSILPLRTNKELEIFCRSLAGCEGWANYFNEMGEAITSTSLSKEGFLMRVAMTSKKISELEDKTGKRKANKGWFKKDKEETSNQL